MFYVHNMFLAGILMVVPNYTGDCLNFGIAIEKARQKGLKVRKRKTIYKLNFSINFSFYTLYG